MTPVCPHCQAPQAQLESLTHAACTQCAALIFRPGSGPRVVMGLRDDATAKHMGETLQGAQFSVIHAVDGAHVLKLISAQPAQAMVLDVALEEITAFRVVEEVRARADWEATRIILMASVYSKTAYKRRPTSLYGADDYLEQHHIHDMLVPKLLELLGKSRPVKIVVPAAASAPPLGDLLRVHALAHSIVADIALYHQPEVEAAVHGEDRPNLHAALDEGRKLLLSMVNPREFATRDPIGDAFTAFVGEMRRMIQ